MVQVVVVVVVAAAAVVVVVVVAAAAAFAFAFAATATVVAAAVAVIVKTKLSLREIQYRSAGHREELFLSKLHVYCIVPLPSIPTALHRLSQRGARTAPAPPPP